MYIQTIKIWVVYDFLSNITAVSGLPVAISKPAGGRVLHLPREAADHPWPRARATEEPEYRHLVRR
jgi:hypothetical protein